MIQKPHIKCVSCEVILFKNLSQGVNVVGGKFTRFMHWTTDGNTRHV